MRRLQVHLCLVVVVFTTGLDAPWGQVFINASEAYDIAQYNWNGHFGAAITLADWDNDHAVGIADLMSFLASFGSNCGQ